MIRFTAFITCSAAFALAVPAAISVAVPVTPSQFTRPPSAAMSAATARAKVSASLSETSFEASQVGSVKLRYSFSKRSKHFRYRLSFKNGSSWQTVNRVKKTGRFKGTHTLRVKKLFGGEPVKVGKYRLQLAADRGSTTLAFTVTSVPPVTPPAVVVPEAGVWKSTSLSGGVSSTWVTVTSLHFTVGSDPATVSKIGFSYNVTHFRCPSSGFTELVSDNSSPITNGQFTRISANVLQWRGAFTLSLEGTFDSPTSAHGTATMDFYYSCPGPVPGGAPQLLDAPPGFSWTATKQ